MARTAADRPGEGNGERVTKTQAEAQAATATRKRQSSVGEQAGSKAGRMDVDEVPAGNGRPKLTRANQELFDMMSTYMDTKFESLQDGMDGVKEEVKQNTGALRNLSKDVHKNRDDIEKLSSQVRDLQKKGGSQDAATVEKMVQKALEKHNVLGAGGVPEEVKKIAEELRSIKRGSTGDGGSDEEKQYWFARRSLRCWPVRGDSEAALLRAVGEFIGSKLRVPASMVEERDIEEVRRLTPRARRPHMRGGNENGQAIKDEVLIVLKDVNTRDTLLRHASNLSAWRDERGPNSIGVRLHIPTHLIGKFNVLNQHGFDLRRKYGGGLKRHIRFDDSEMQLLMDVKLPDQEEWMRVDYDFALEVTRATRKSTTLSARGRLSSLGEAEPAQGSTTLEKNTNRVPQGLFEATREQPGEPFRWGRKL